MSTLPKKVVADDHRLEQQATNTTEELARLRWHWTLDESNPKRVSMREYAREVGRSHPAIKMMADGYAAWRGKDVLTSSLTGEIAKANVSAERAAAAEAIAEAKGIGTASVLAHNRQEIRDTLSAAADAAERKGTTAAEEIPRVARAHERQRQSAAKQRAEDKQRHGLRYVQIEGHLAAAKDRLARALDVAHDVELDGEETELIVDMLRQVNAVLRLLDARFVGDSGTDWEAEKEQLLGGAR